MDNVQKHNICNTSSTRIKSEHIKTAIEKRQRLKQKDRMICACAQRNNFLWECWTSDVACDVGRPQTLCASNNRRRFMIVCSFHRDVWFSHIYIGGNCSVWWDKPERAGIAVMICTRISEVIVSYLGQNIGYPNWGVLWFSSVPPGKWILPQLGHRRFLPNPFQCIIYHSY
jgi:hypothetical protein